jgi:ribosome recycling factor
MDNTLIEANQKIQTAIDHFIYGLSSIRAGRANPALIENIPVVAYDTRLKLTEVGSISAPQQNLLTVQIWDASIMQNVVKAIQEANLGLNPSFEGELIRLPIPQLTAERREELIKIIHQKKEEAKINLRQIRQDIRGDWEALKEKGEIGEDEFDRRAKILQEILDKAIVKLDDLGKSKEEELSQL